MAREAEIERVRKDEAVWRAEVRRLITKHEESAFTDWELDFLDGLDGRKRIDELSYRQCEVMLGIRDDLAIVFHYKDASVGYLLKAAYEGRLNYDDGGRDWVVALYAENPVSVRKKTARRLWALAKQAAQAEGDEDILGD